MRIINKYIIAAFALLVSISAIASEKSSSTKVFKAMEDELERNMTQLELDDSGTPFYIGYWVTSAQRGKVAATMGSLVESSLSDGAWCSVNVKMGDYALNDEKYWDKVNKINHNDGYFSVPLDLNYDGIRKSLWIMTNNVYKGAAEKYKNKTEQMERQGIAVDDLPSPDFSKEEVKETMQDELENEISKVAFERNIRELSAHFKNFSDIIESDVELNYQHIMHYSVNSEGIKFQTPYRFYVLTVNATMLDNNNHTFNQSLEYYHNSFKALPSVDEITSDINLLVENMQAYKKADKYKDVYNGPVLFMDKAGVDMCYSKTFKKGMGLVGNPRNLVFKKKEGLVRAEFKTWEDYISKKVVDKKLSVELKPLMSEYKGQPMLGSFSLDLDGLVPEETTLLIKDGMLQQQIVGRTPTAIQHTSSRHKRFYVQKNSVSHKIAPSVVKISTNEVKTDEEIKASMLALAEEEGLEYVFIVKALDCHADKAPVSYVKMNVSDGSEEVVSGVSFKYSDRTLMKVEALGDGEYVTNALLPDYAEIENKMKRYKGAPPEILEIIKKQMIGIQGTPISVICPDALLLESAELTGVKNNIKSASRVVPSPMME
ncbi:hypothetical protein [Labilibacter marinus]|uniref:hypothetical protein n=1 Tax=Labilibacter marinus TaxID=1477105 RepID=UPI000950067F|nr:hypothetical protein [Labilibacter marinus]